MGDLERAAARMICVGFDGLGMTQSLRTLLDRGVSSIILFTRNYESPEQLCNLTREIKEAADRPILICVDQEGGRVQRFREPFTTIPSMRDIGRAASEALAMDVGIVLGRELRAVNIDMDIAPVLDVDSNPQNPVIGARSFGGDPALVGHMGCAVIRGLQQNDVAACGKHFPGHGDTSVDSHLDLPRISHSLQRLERIELPPFEAAIARGVAAIMTSHILFEAIDPVRPATMSLPVIRDLLRGRMGFERVVISDDLEMKAIVDHFGIERAVVEGANAAVDLFMVCSREDLQHRAIDSLIDAVRNNTVDVEHIERANRRLDALFNAFVKPPEAWNDDARAIIGCARHRELFRGVMA